MLQSDWSDPRSQECLKTVLKWEIQHLLQRLADGGEEALLLTVSLSDGQVAEMGSQKGQGFLSLSALNSVKSQFLAYCKAHYENNEIDKYENLSSGEVTAMNATNLASDNIFKRKHPNTARRKKVMKTSAGKSLHIAPHLFPLLNDVCINSEGSDSPTRDLDLDERPLSRISVAKDGLSRRKRTPKKIVTNNASESDTCEQNMDYTHPMDTQDIKCEPCDEQFSENQSEKLNLFDSQNQSTKLYLSSGSRDDVLNIEKPQVEHLDDQSENSEELSSFHKLNTDMEDSSTGVAHRQSSTPTSFAKCSLQCNVNNQTTECKNSAPVMELSTSCQDSKILLSSFSEKPKIKLKNTTRKAVHIKMIKDDDDTVQFAETLADSKAEIGMIENVNSFGEWLTLSKTRLAIDGSIKFVSGGKSESHLSVNSDFESMDTARKVMAHRPSGRGFKAAASDEDPNEMAVLDAAKLGVGRYQCPICCLITRDRHDLKRHLRTHTKEKPHECYICLKKFTRKWDLENHLHRHTEKTFILRETPSKSKNKVHGESTYEELMRKLVSETKFREKELMPTGLQTGSQSEFVNSSTNSSNSDVALLYSPTENVENCETETTLILTSMGTNNKLCAESVYVEVNTKMESETKI